MENLLFLGVPILRHFRVFLSLAQTNIVLFQVCNQTCFIDLICCNLFLIHCLLCNEMAGWYIMSLVISVYARSSLRTWSPIDSEKIVTVFLPGIWIYG